MHFVLNKAPILDKIKKKNKKHYGNKNSIKDYNQDC